MDIRTIKTEKAIKNAFIALRAKKALEKITVKELCQEACINKSTFYSHYDDIYALSGILESETVASIISSIPQAQEYSAENPENFTRGLCIAFLSHTSLINIIFSGQEEGRLAARLDTEIKKIIYRKYPEYEKDIRKSILLSYCIQGAYHAYLYHQAADTDTLIQMIADITKALRPLC